MANITQPRVGIPIATVTINGRSFDCLTHPEFNRWFESLMGRVGGPTGSSTTDLNVAQFEDAGIEETKALHYELVNETGQMPGPDERIAVLEKRIAALEQGMSL